LWSGPLHNCFLKAPIHSARYGLLLEMPSRSVLFRLNRLWLARRLRGPLWSPDAVTLHSSDQYSSVQDCACVIRFHYFRLACSHSSSIRPIRPSTPTSFLCLLKQSAVCLLYPCPIPTATTWRPNSSAVWGGTEPLSEQEGRRVQFP
jgi:hypothetical protein